MPSHPVSRRIAAPIGSVYAALVDPRAVERWRAPDGMTCRVHEFDARVGGTIRASVNHRDGRETGKSGVATDTYQGWFVDLDPERRVVEALEFETTDPAMSGGFTVTTTLTDFDGRTEVTVVYTGLPAGIDPVENGVGTAMALAKLAALVELPGAL